MINGCEAPYSPRQLSPKHPRLPAVAGKIWLSGHSLPAASLPAARELPGCQQSGQLPAGRGCQTWGWRSVQPLKEGLCRSLCATTVHTHTPHTQVHTGTRAQRTAPTGTHVHVHPPTHAYRHRHTRECTRAHRDTHAQSCTHRHTRAHRCDLSAPLGFRVKGSSVLGQLLPFWPVFKGPQKETSALHPAPCF